MEFNPSAKHSISNEFLVSPHGGKLVKTVFGLCILFVGFVFITSLHSLLSKIIMYEVESI